ncbi:nucleotidyltransferase [Bacillus tequilensis]|uniref:SMODS domain-containing nucleotidyltransferase n=1 Tax=Bacillus subtilis TaxID=1423 RepID=UPI001325B55A|nr:nucleotidyltransferase [Bacillus subtilis]MEC2266553.1 nucleotidyltransferase [Bacillus subtilis]MUG00706.1 nucleotidyltransferase [Bacillus tequilensis]
MSVNSYLSNLSSDLVLSLEEKESIQRSINALSKNLNYYFCNDELHTHFQFGSSTRGTILPRRADSKSDIDYMVVFKNPNGYKPQTLLSYLKSFMNKYYSRSEIYRDSPTMVLELDHIKFELVPAVQDDWGNLSIPAPKTDYLEWMLTDPKGFDSKLTTANINNNSRLKPVIRLMKYWNRNKLHGHYSSFALEKWLVERYNIFSKSSIKDYVYESIEILISSNDDSQTFKDRLEYAKKVVRICKELEKSGYPATAKDEIKKLFPEL